MKTLAKVLRRAADKVDQPRPHPPWLIENTTTTGHPYKITWRTR